MVGAHLSRPPKYSPEITMMKPILTNPRMDITFSIFYSTKRMYFITFFGMDRRGYPCHMLIIRNGNVALSISINGNVACR